ncbi:MAG: cadherin repeat domain-containing protein [Flavobacteriaceae bacterium]|nr:cadherin repeat domain-containing protein [Flavobacteriaceae bacterium]
MKNKLIKFLIPKSRAIILKLFSLFLVLSCGGGGDDDDTTFNNTSNEITTVITASDFLVTIPENPEDGDSLGSIEASVNQGTLEFSIISQSVPDALEVNSSTGEVTVADSSLFVFQNVQSLTANVRITSGNIIKDITVTINLTRVIEYNIWDGEIITFSKENGADPTLNSSQDYITDNVKITRGNDGGQFYNIVVESSYDKDNSPVGTEWALGTIDEISTLAFEPFRAATGKPANAVGKNMVLHLITDDVYLSVKITSWAKGKNGGFTYERSTQN